MLRARTPQRYEQALAGRQSTPPPPTGAQRELLAENRKIFEKMKHIHQTSRLYIHHPPGPRTLNLLRRKEEVLRRTSANQHLVKTLRNVQPTYKQDDWRQHIQRTQQYKQINSKFRTRADPLLTHFSRKVGTNLKNFQSLNASSKKSIASPQASFEHKINTPRSPFPSLQKGLAGAAGGVSSASTLKQSPGPRLPRSHATPPKPRPGFVRHHHASSQIRTARSPFASSRRSFATPGTRTPTPTRPDLYRISTARKQLEHLQRLEQSPPQVRRKLEFELDKLDFHNLDSAFSALQSYVDHCKEASDEYTSNNDEPTDLPPTTMPASQMQTNTEFLSGGGGGAGGEAGDKHKRAILRSVEKKNYLTQQGLYRHN